MYKIIFTLILAVIISGCAANSPKKLVSKLNTELKSRHGLKEGAIIARFDLEQISKKKTLFASYYSGIINHSHLNEKFFSDFSRNYRHKDLLQITAYRKIGLLNATIINIDNKHNLLPRNIKYKLKRIANNFNKHPEMDRRDKTDYVAILSALHSSTKFIPLFVPLENPIVTSKFGLRIHPYKKTKTMHFGLDLAGAMHCHVYAAADGIVESIGKMNGYGNIVTISHNQNIKTRYAHLSKMVVDQGEKVLLGQIIGHQGCTGTSAGHHLHLEILVNGKAVDPLLFVSHSL